VRCVVARAVLGVVLMAPRLRAAARPLLASALLVPASLGLTQAVTAQAATAAPAQAASGATAAAVAARTASAVTAGSASQASAAASAQTASAKAARRLRLNAWNYALRQRRKPYIWGGTGPAGFDCSGLVYASYRSRGLMLPRTTYGMLGSWHLVRIRKSRARRGDLAFFGTGHVELYDSGSWTYGAASAGTRIGFHRMNSFWHPTMYFEVRR
jgi:peptidoglycan DL-endopeptidase CwlO